MAKYHALTRRHFASAALIGLAPKAERRIDGGFIHESHDLGHRIRDRIRWPAPRETRRVPLVIVGGGIAGLSAAWWLAKRGFQDFLLLEMEGDAGGNARSGANDVSAYPLAAHYVPVPGKNSTLVRELFSEIGLLTNGQWDERWLCHSPQERLFLHGRWQEGLEPALGPTQTDRAQFARFDERIEEFRQSGVFTIPSRNGRSGARHRGLDTMTMADWMEREGLTSPYLRWYVNYACRDDYGTSMNAISAWAGVHYFAARESEDKGPLTWPEGNGWIVKRLMERLRMYVRTNQMVHRIQRSGKTWIVDAGDIRYQAQAVIFAAPTFLAPWLIDPAPPPYPLEYAPWMTANLTLDRWPEESDESQPAWDNVIFDSGSLGYVVATHQNLKTHQPESVWTWYHAFSEGRAADQRRVLLGGDWEHWKEFVLQDLERAHPDIRQCVRRVDLFRMGHAMPRPAPGSIFGLAYPEVIQQSLFLAHSDLTRLSLFEEAQSQGVIAATRAMALLG